MGPQDGNEDASTGQVCWLCYETASVAELKPWKPLCRCRGSVQFSHKECLLEWLKQSEQHKCPQCNYEYVITTDYKSFMSKILGHARVPMVVSLILIGCAYFVFHKAVKRFKAGLRERVTGNTSASSSFNSFASPFNNLGSHFSGMGSPHSGTLTGMAAELELFAWVLVGFYWIIKWGMQKLNMTNTLLISTVEQFSNDYTSDVGYTDMLHSIDILLILHRSVCHLVGVAQEKLIKKEINILPLVA